MRCLLVSYAEIGVNSTDHAVVFGRGLAALGWDVRVAALLLGARPASFDFYSFAGDGSLAPVESGAGQRTFDIVHVWTPRGAIWDFIERFHGLIGNALILHLEDDEGEILRLFSRGKVQPDDEVSSARLQRLGLQNLSHPLLARCLAACADGVTVLSPELEDMVLPSIPCLQLTPPLDPAQYTQSGRSSAAQDEAIVVYAGGVHPAVAGDFLELCKAVGMLAKKGRRIRLVRYGPPALPPNVLTRGARMAGRFEDAGLFSHARLAPLLANATVLVQPGAPSAFNRRRLPAKLAPYLASGTPVVMPACYAWIGVKNGEHAMMFGDGGGAEIARAIAAVLEAPEQGREMGRNAAAFARQKFELSRCCGPLDSFYRRVLEGARPLRWQSIRKPRIELPLWLAAQPERAEASLRGALTRFAAEEARLGPSSRGDAARSWAPAPPLVSVIVPNFNHRRFLPERLGSIFAQTYPNIEVVFLDDGSTDGSLDYVRSLESPFPLRILPNGTNRGRVLGQWHLGMRAAQGDFVWIAESDDHCQPELIERLMSVALRNPAIGLAYAQSQVVDEDGREIESHLEYTDEIDPGRWREDFVNSGQDEAANYLVIRNTIPNASACLFRKSALLSAGLESIPLRVCGDWMAYARICEHHDIAFVAEHLNFHRRHGATARAGASRDGLIIAETYAVQGYIRDHFDVPPAAQEAAGRATFRELLHVLKEGPNTRFFVDDGGLLELARPLDPRLRERMAGRPREEAPVLEVRLADGSQPLKRAYDAWRWTTLRVGPCRGAASLVPITRPGLVALRRFRARDPATGKLLWSAETQDDYRRIGLDGGAQRVGSRDALEILAWNGEPLLRLPLPEDAVSGAAYELEFDVRIAAIESYEPPTRRLPTSLTKRALFILPHLEMGGADRFNLDLIAQFTQRFDWEVTVAATRSSRNPWLEKFRTLAGDVLTLPSFLPFGSYPDFLAYLIESRQPDVIYLSHSELGYRLLPWLKTAFPTLPVIDLVHIVMDDWNDGGFPRLSCRARPWLDRTVATSQDLQRWLVKNGADGDAVDLVYTGIDTAHWRHSAELTEIARARWGIPSDRPTILYAARFTPQKQPRLLAGIVRRLAERGRTFSLLLVGDGPDRPWLEEHLCQVHGRSVMMLGPVDPDEMRLVMSAADLLLLPSRSEGIALVLFEAMSMEVVPVTTDVGGQRELVTPDCGVLLPSDERLGEAMAEALDALLEDEPFRHLLATTGRNRVEVRFRLEQMGERMNAIFRGESRREEAPLRAAAAPVDISRIAGDLAEPHWDDPGADAWNQRRGRGVGLVSFVSLLAGWLRRSPLRHWFRRLEARYGTRVGRWIIGHR
jgi:glycosyltransferase involved in cell wall biosynthesis